MTDADQGAFRYPYLLDDKLSPEHKTMLLQADIESGKDARQTGKEREAASLERLKFWHNTPLVVALVGVITIAAQFGSSYFLSDQTGDIGAEQRKREFAYKIMETELSKTQDTDERAKVLLFLAKAGVLDGLNVAELEKLAADVEAIPTTIGQGIPSYNEPLPESVAGQTPTGNTLHTLAVEELNRNIEENASLDRVRAYWSVLPADQAVNADATLPWGAVFISWLIHQTGNPDGLAMTPDSVGLWRSATSRGLTLVTPDDVLPGDVAIYAQSAANTEKLRAGGFGPGAACIVHKVAGTMIDCIMGNIRNAVRIQPQDRQSDRLIGYFRVGTKTS